MDGEEEIPETPESPEVEPEPVPAEPPSEPDPDPEPAPQPPKQERRKMAEGSSKHSTTAMVVTGLVVAVVAIGATMAVLWFIGKPKTA